MLCSANRRPHCPICCSLYCSGIPVHVLGNPAMQLAAQQLVAQRLVQQQMMAGGQIRPGMQMMPAQMLAQMQQAQQAAMQQRMSAAAGAGAAAGGKKGSAGKKRGGRGAAAAAAPSAAAMFAAAAQQRARPADPSADPGGAFGWADVCVCLRACLPACMHAGMHACMRACVRVVASATFMAPAALCTQPCTLMPYRHPWSTHPLTPALPCAAGKVVWAKVSSFPWWPAKTMDPQVWRLWVAVTVVVGLWRGVGACLCRASLLIGRGASWLG